MIIQFFRTNRPIVFFNLLVYTLLLRGSFLLFPELAPHGQDSFLAPYALALINMQHIPIWTVQLADILITFIEAIILNVVLTSNNMFDRSTYVPAMLFITVSSIFAPWVAIHLHTLAAFFLLISMYNLFTLSGKELSRDNVFYTALYVSIGSLFYFPVALFLPVILVTLISRGYSFFDVMLALVGFTLPYYFIGIGYYYQDDLPGYLLRLKWVFYPKPLMNLDLGLAQIIMLVYIVLLTIFGYLKISSDIDMKILRLRRLVYIVLGFFAIIIIATPFVTGNRLIYLQMLAIPASVFMAKFFDAERVGIVRNILFSLLLLGVLFFQLYHFGIL